MAAKPPGSLVWEAYAPAYERRYGVTPVRNLDTNRWAKQLAEKVPITDAPALAAWFVTHPNGFYIQRGHSLEMLVRDHGKLYTEWQTSKPMTQTRAAAQDRTASNPFLPLAEEARRNERQNS